MQLIKKISALLLFIFSSILSNAQFVDFGTDPARLKWNSVKTNHYKIIYPQGNDSMAYRYAVLLENAVPQVSKSIGKPTFATFRVPVVLHSNNMLSNGMVAWAPRRMELITTPSPKIYPQNWDMQLALHESRHVMQTGKLAQGVFKPLYYLIGEQSSGISAFGIPKWFFEGDAVVSETALSNSGRGRLPEFGMEFRTRLLSNEFFSFDKWFLGSFKNHTADFYALGYFLTSYARFEYGANIWGKVTDRYAKRIYAIPPFSNALKHYTGINAKGLFNNAFEYLKKDWEQQYKANKEKSDKFYGNITFISEQQKFYTSYKYPQIVNDSSIIAVKSGLKDISFLVSINNSQEKRLTYLGNINSRIVQKNNRIYWTEYVSGLRWTHENYSVVKYYDLETNKTVTLTPRKRYLSPAINCTGEIIAVSHYDTQGNNYIVLIDAEKGTEIKRFPTLANTFIKDMSFGNNGNIITTAVSDEGMSLLQLNTYNGDWSGLMRPTNVNITSPSLLNGKLYFEAGLNGINNIYSLDTLRLQTYQLTSARYGVFEPTLSTNGERLVFSDYDKDGYRIASVPIDKLEPERTDISQAYRFALAEKISEQEDYNINKETLTPVKFEPKTYRRGLNLFKIHSWAPFYYDVMDIVNLQADDFTTIISPGATIISQNELNTAITQAGWYYKNGYHHGKLSFTYMGWYPVIDLNVDYGDKAIDIKWGKDDEGNIGLYGFSTNRNYVEAKAQVYIPFNFTHNHYIRGVQPSVSYHYTNTKYQQYQSKELRDFQYILAELRHYNYRKLAKRDIIPRWGYQIRLQYLNIPFDTKNFGALYAARFTTYVPGFIRNDGLMLRFGYQYQDNDNKDIYIYVPKQLIDEVRGYSYMRATRQQFMFKADYSFNILCPDFAIGSLAYVKRLRANIFYDISHNQRLKESGWSSQHSFGADLIFDWNAFRLNYPLSLGVRVIKPLINVNGKKNIQAEVLFSIAFQ